MFGFREVSWRMHAIWQLFSVDSDPNMFCFLLEGYENLHEPTPTRV